MKTELQTAPPPSPTAGRGQLGGRRPNASVPLPDAVTREPTDESPLGSPSGTSGTLSPKKKWRGRFRRGEMIDEATIARLERAYRSDVAGKDLERRFRISQASIKALMEMRNVPLRRHKGWVTT